MTNLVIQHIGKNRRLAVLQYHTPTELIIEEYVVVQWRWFMHVKILARNVGSLISHPMIVEEISGEATSTQESKMAKQVSLS